MKVRELINNIIRPFDEIGEGEVLKLTAAKDGSLLILTAAYKAAIPPEEIRTFETVAAEAFRLSGLRLMQGFKHRLLQTVRKMRRKIRRKMRLYKTRRRKIRLYKTHPRLNPKRKSRSTSRLTLKPCRFYRRVQRFCADEKSAEKRYAALPISPTERSGATSLYGAMFLNMNPAM
jgi:hypothetical protein